MNTNTKFTGNEAEALQTVTDRFIPFFPGKDTFKKITMIPAAFTIGIILLISSTGMAGITNPDSAKKIPVSELRANMRQLLEERVALTHNVILCLVDNQPGIDSAVKEIVSNQTATANLMKKFYGPDAGKEWSKLFYYNITCAADVMIACRNGHANAYEKADKKWKESTGEIFAFLTQVNPSWRMYGTKKMLDDNMKCITGEIMAIKSKDYNSDAQAYNNAREDAAALADVLSETIIQHFPEMFQDFESMPPSVGQK